MSCCFCHASGLGAYKLGRGKTICDACVRAAAAAWGWGPRPAGPPFTLWPHLAEGLELVDHDVVYRPVVAVDRPFSAQSARHRDEVNPLGGPGRLLSLAAPPKRWDTLGLDCASGLLRFRVPEGDEPSTMQSLLEHWNSWANYLELLPACPLRTYLEAVQELLCNRWQEAADLLEEFASHPDSVNLKAICHALLGDWTRANLAWERLAQTGGPVRRLAQHNLDELRLARGRDHRLVMDLVLLAGAIGTYERISGTLPERLEDLYPRHLSHLPRHPDGRPYVYCRRPGGFALHAPSSAYPCWEPGLGVLLRAEDRPPGQFDRLRFVHTPLEAVAGRPQGAWVAACRESLGDLRGAMRALPQGSLERDLVQVAAGLGFPQQWGRVVEPERVRRLFFASLSRTHRHLPQRLELIFALTRGGLGRLAGYLGRAGDSYAEQATALLLEAGSDLQAVEPAESYTLMFDGYTLEAALALELGPDSEVASWMTRLYGVGDYAPYPDQGTDPVFEALERIEQNKPEEALACLAGKAAPRAGLVRLQAVAALGDWERACIVAGVLVAQNGWFEPDYWLARLARAEQPEIALAAARRAAAGRPRNLRYRALLASMLEGDEAEEHRQLVARHRPDLQDPVANLANLPLLPLRRPVDSQEE
ncbi:MAG: hypothetical protein KC910_27335 [Candidatus Eremiobacteraeota bacterium]|nr:hypothetical protein [Candidatus Eremiobacteraeota bacterium]